MCQILPELPAFTLVSRTSFHTVEYDETIIQKVESPPFSRCQGDLTPFSPVSVSPNVGRNSSLFFAAAGDGCMVTVFFCCARSTCPQNSCHIWYCRIVGTTVNGYRCRVSRRCKVSWLELLTGFRIGITHYHTDTAVQI